MIQSRSYSRSRAFGPDEADYAVQIGGNLKAYAKNERMRSPNLYCDKATYIEQVGDVPVEKCDNLYRTKLRSRWPTQSTFQDEIAAWQTLDRTTRGPTYVEREAIRTVKKRGSSEGREVRSRSDRFMDLLNRVSTPVELESHHKKYNRGVVEAYQSHGYKNQAVERHLQIVPPRRKEICWTSCRSRPMKGTPWPSVFSRRRSRKEVRNLTRNCTGNPFIRITGNTHGSSSRNTTQKNHPLMRVFSPKIMISIGRGKMEREYNVVVLNTGWQNQINPENLPMPKIAHDACLYILCETTDLFDAFSVAKCFDFSRKTSQVFRLFQKVPPCSARSAENRVVYTPGPPLLHPRGVPLLPPGGPADDRREFERSFGRSLRPYRL